MREARRLTFALALAAAACGRGGQASADRYAVHEEDDATFTFEVPSNWSYFPDEQAAARNVSYVLLTPDRSLPEGKALYALSVYYYPPGHGTFRNPAAYVQRHRVEFPRWELGPVEQRQLPAGESRSWTVSRPMAADPELGGGERVKESVAVVAAKQGFFVLTYTAPEERHGAHAKDFEHLLSTFQTKL